MHGAKLFGRNDVCFFVASTPSCQESMPSEPMCLLLLKPIRSNFDTRELDTREVIQFAGHNFSL